MAKQQTYYYKTLDFGSYITAYGKITSAKEPKSTPSRVILTKSEYDYLVTVNANKPQPSDDMHEVRILDNHDGTYTYIEVEKLIEEVAEGEE